MKWSLSDSWIYLKTANTFNIDLQPSLLRSNECRKKTLPSKNGAATKNSHTHSMCVFDSNLHKVRRAAEDLITRFVMGLKLIEGSRFGGAEWPRQRCLIPDLGIFYAIGESAASLLAILFVERTRIDLCVFSWSSDECHRGQGEAKLGISCVLIWETKNVRAEDKYS